MLAEIARWNNGEAQGVVMADGQNRLRMGVFPLALLMMLGVALASLPQTLHGQQTPP